MPFHVDARHSCRCSWIWLLPLVSHTNTPLQQDKNNGPKRDTCTQSKGMPYRSVRMRLLVPNCDVGRHTCTTWKSKSEGGRGNQATNRLGCCVLFPLHPSFYPSPSPSPLSLFSLSLWPLSRSLYLFVCVPFWMSFIFISVSLTLVISSPFSHHFHLLQSLLPPPPPPLCLLLYPFFPHDKK